MVRHVETAKETVTFEAMYRAELSALVALGSTLTGNRELGADLAHEALARAYRDWRTVGALERPGAWARRVLINLAIDAHRQRARERIAVARATPDPIAATVAGVSNEFWAAVRNLPERQRAAVALRYIEDLSVIEIAKILDVTTGTVKTSLFMARRSLAITLGAEEVLDDDS
jgi:RNA polymerase sigma-70 factor, ECF subfamily